jgi:uncharacterized protein (TIGR03118 family)
MRTWFRSLSGIRQTAARRPVSFRPAVTPLEDRCLLSANVLQTNLVSDLPGVAAVTDPNLVNPWGITESAGSPFWISDNNAGVSTLYTVPGLKNTPVTVNGLVVSIPTPVDLTGTSGAPTGTVFNTDLGGGGFMVSGVDKNNKPASAPAIFLFATEDGTIVGWNPGVNPQGFDPAKAGTYATIAVDNSGNNFTNPDPAQQTGAVYKGLAIAQDPNNNPIFAGDANSNFVLYAANFRSGQVEVYDTTFTRVMLPTGAFQDPNLPQGYAPFNVQVLNGKVYVTYAKQNATKHDDVAGHGHGFVDVFNLDGSPGLAGGKERLISRGALDSPWGLVIAPSSFGTNGKNLAGALLVGNFGNGRIHAYDPTTGQFLAELKDPDGEPIQIDGLWALKVGNGKAGGDNQTVYFTAGLFGETHGLFGALNPVAAGTPEGPAEEQFVHGALVVFQTAADNAINDLLAGASKATLGQDDQALDAAFATLRMAEEQLIRDERRDGNDTAAKAHKSELETAEDLFEAIDHLLDHRL